MTTILGINAYHGDASAAVVVDGQLVSAVLLLGLRGVNARADDSGEKAEEMRDANKHCDWSRESTMNHLWGPNFPTSLPQR